MVVALLYNNTGNPAEEDLSASQKAITNLCQETDYQETCQNSLKNTNSSDPKELIEIAFQAAIKQINEAAENSTLLAELERDPRGKAALQSCRELSHRAADDLQRSFAKFKNFDVSELDTIISDLKIWLSGAITYQETCLDGFEGVDGGAGDKMREFLTTSMQMTSNGLAMVNGVSQVLESIIGQNFNSRRLLSLESDGEPNWIDFNKRKLLKSSKDEIKPDIVVAKDGSGDYTTINDALKHVPINGNETFTLYVKKGVYEEKVTINATMKHLLLVGDGPTKTKITGNLNFIDGTNTYHTATVVVGADHFMARDIGFENSAGAEKHQAVALRVSGDMAIFYNCQMDGYQDTLYAHTYRQFYRDCVISGTIDFIFGDSAAVFQNCVLVVRKPLSNQQCIVTAQGRKDIRQPTGLVMQNCSFVSDPEYYPLRFTNKAYLGRPWKEYSRTIIMESFIDDLIQPEGWLPWNLDFGLETLFYTEFNNRGPSSGKEHRVKWAGIKELPSKRIKRFTPDRFLEGSKWIESTKIPYDGKFIFKPPKYDPEVEYSPLGPEENKDLGPLRDKSLFVTPKTDDDKKNKEGGGGDDHHKKAPESQIAAAPWIAPYAEVPSEAPAMSPVAQPAGESQRSLLSLLFRGW
ncbi:hypothetical protein ACS0TY_005662 [Phlomoides rotata]